MNDLGRNGGAARAKRVLSVGFYGISALTAVLFLGLAAALPVQRDVLLGAMLGCTLPVLLSTAVLCRVYKIDVRGLRRPQKAWALAVPLLICGGYLAYTLAAIVVMAIALFFVTLKALF